jgi:hypothetical protein
MFPAIQKPKVSRVIVVVINSDIENETTKQFAQVLVRIFRKTDNTIRERKVAP